jgi:hypothetical protein
MTPTSTEEKTWSQQHLESSVICVESPVVEL